VQRRFAQDTHPEWMIGGTVFTTVTVNNTWPTAVHTDKGDLETGFSNLAVLRRGDYRGGIFTFPRYRIGFDTHDGDLLLMDAHEYHGNTAIECSTCGQLLNGYHECAEDVQRSQAQSGHGLPEPVERISVVAYYRTKMHTCGTATDEAERQRTFAETRAQAAIGE